MQSYERNLTLPVPADRSPAVRAPHGECIMPGTLLSEEQSLPSSVSSLEEKPASVLSPDLRGVEGAQLLYTCLEQIQDATSKDSTQAPLRVIMAVSKHTRTSAVAAGVVIATAMIAGTLSIPAHAAEVDAAVAPSPAPETSSSSEILMAGPLFILAGLFVLSVASFIQNGLVAWLV